MIFGSNEKKEETPEEPAKTEASDPTEAGDETEAAEEKPEGTGDQGQYLVIHFYHSVRLYCCPM